VADAQEILAAAQSVVVVDWPTPDVPETLAHSGFEVTVHGGPGPDDWRAYKVDGGEVVVTKAPGPPDRAEVVYTHRPIDELPEILEMATQVGARVVWVHSGRSPDGAKDPRGCWMPEQVSATARGVVESAGFVYVEEPYIADVARRLGPL
jgi:hypothetical protein